MRRVSKKIAVVTAVVFGLTVAAPVGAVRDPELPVSWLWDWVGQRPAWAKPDPTGPKQTQGKGGVDGQVSATVTTADGGAGRAPKPAPNTLDAYQPHVPNAERQVTEDAALGFDPATSDRDPSRSDARSDVFKNEDGSLTEKTYVRPINFKAKDGSWQPIDTDLEKRADGRLHVAANSLDASVAAAVTAPKAAAPASPTPAAEPAAGAQPSTPAQPDAAKAEPAKPSGAKLAELKLPTGESIGYWLDGANPVVPTVKGSTATYAGILPETDLELQTFDAGIKETMVLKSRSAANVWTFPLALNGLTPRVDATGSIELRNAAGKAVAWLPKGFMQDAKVDPRSGAPAESHAVTYQIIDWQGGSALRIEADRAWLDDPARAYPVRVDPTATTGVTGDVYVDTTSSTGNQNGDNLPIGTYDGGKTKARSFIHLDEFDDKGFKGKRITKAQLKLYLTWTFSCTVDRAFDVRASTEKWTVADLTKGGWPGPSYSGSIGSLTVTDPGAACKNTGGDRTKGKWVTVPLNVATFDKWAKGEPNYGLALTASESDSNAWKRFTSANFDSGKYKPVLELTYASNIAPQVDVRYPANNAVVPTLTPQLLVKGHDADNWPAKGLTYTYTVTSADGKTTVATSPAVTSAWTVPAGKLDWNTTYLYTIKANDTVSTSAATTSYAFTTSVPQPVVTSGLAQNGGKGFDASNGNYTTSATDASVTTVGPSLAITRNYNSLDTRRDTAFGAGWSSILDAKATQVPDAAGVVQSVRVTYPTGEEVAFGRSGNGAFVPPAGRFATFAETKSGTTVTGYTLTDKQATVYTFGRGAAGGVFRLTAITDANGRKLSLEYAADGNPSTLTSASGRKLTVQWSTPAGASAPHVSAVATDRLDAANPDSANTWTYGYENGDRLSTVCQPDNNTQCWKYGYTTTSQYRNTVLNLDPESYWPLGDPDGSAASSAVLSNAGMDTARYNAVALGQPGPLPGSAASAAGFNGTSSYVQLPSNLLAGGQYQSVSMWFKTATPGGVLFSYNGDPMSKGTTTGDYTPALYIDKFGKLRSELWTGSATTALNSNTVVTDDKWHHVVLAGAGNTQTLYLDGVAKGSLNGTIYLATSASGANINIGAGYVGGGWPDHANTGVSPAKATFFKGAISDVAFFNQTLDSTRAALLNRTGRAEQPVLDAVLRPSGGVTARVGYNKTTGRTDAVIDENGGTWKLDQPTVAGSSRVYAAAVLGARPQDYWRLGDNEVTDAVNEVAGGTATYNNVTLNAAGPFPDATAAQFDGSTSFVSLPPEDIPTGGPHSAELWFKMPAGNTKGGVLFGYQAPALDEPNPTEWVPALYVGTDGKLRGQFWDSTGVNPMTAPTAVNDGKWHHVALTATTNAQALYLDGVVVAGRAGNLMATGATSAYLGTGRWAGGWPAHGTTDTGWFPGAIADFAFYQSALNGAQVGEHFATVKRTAPVAMTMIAGVAKAVPMPVSQVTVTTPTGAKQTSSFDLVNGNRIVAQTDELGNTTRFGYDVGGFSSMVYDPNGVLTQTLQDARGNTKQSITCQDQSANKCSSVYFTYFPDATSSTLAPNPKNDLLLTVRDGRSASATDDTYLTSNAYDDKGNLTSVTDPLKRVTRTSFTDAATVAADGGTPPPGLPTKMVTPAGAEQTVTYFKSGDVAQVTETNGKITKFAYDALGQVRTQTEVTEANPAGVVTSFTYDRMGREVTQTDPPSTNRVTGAVHTLVATSKYDVDGNPLEVTRADATGGDAARTERHGYDEFGRETSYTTAGGATTRFTYDSSGRMVDQTGPDGQTTRSEYDTAGNLLRSILVGWKGESGDAEPRDLVVARSSYDPAGRLATETDAMGWTTTHTYTDNGLEAEVSRTDGTETFVLTAKKYDAAGNVIEETANNGVTRVTHAYDAAGRETSTVHDPDGAKRTTQLSYNLDDHVVASTLKDASGSVLSKMEALVDPAGRTLAETTYLSEGTEGTAPAGRWRFAGSVSPAADTAGNSPATSTGGVTHSDERGGSAVFAGTGQLLTAGTVLDTSRSFSVSAWLKLTDKDRLYRAVSAGSVEQSPFDLSYDKDSDRWRFMVVGTDVPNTGAATEALSTSVPQAGQWTHLVGTYDAAAGSSKLYVDGKLEGTHPAKAFKGSGPMVIGAGMWNSAYGNEFKGAISDVQVYQQALSAGEAADVHSGALPAGGPKLSRTSYVYDEDDNVVAATDPNGNTSYVAYDEDGNPVKSTAPAAKAETVNGATVANAVSWTGYNTFGEVTDTKDALGNWSVTHYDADGRPVRQRMPEYTAPGSTTPVTAEINRTYHPGGELATVADPFGNVTRYEYDQLDRLTKTTTADDGVTRYSYDLTGDLLSVTDPTGAVSSATWDYLGRRVTSTDVIRQDATSATTSFKYGRGGWLAEVTSATGVKTSTTYNDLGEPVTVQDGARNVTKMTYDGAGRAVKTTMPDNTYRTTKYDMGGRPLRSASYDAADQLLQSESTEYDAAGNAVATIDGRKTRTTFEYDATGLLVKERQPISGSDAIETSFGYDLEGNRTRFTDGRGNAFWTTYNSWGLTESQIEPATAAHPQAADRTFTFAYDKAGRVAKQSLPGGVTISNEYDLMGQLKKQSGQGAEATTEDRTFEYDRGGRLTKFANATGSNEIGYDDRGLARSITGSSGTSEFRYNGDGALTSRTDAAGTTAYGYDGAGRLNKLVNSGKGVDQTYAYNSLSLVDKITYSGGNSRKFAYDGLKRLTGDELKTAGGASVAKIEYGWNDNDDLTSKKTTNFGDGTTITNTYDYDLADRLTSWNNGTTTTAYAYDKSGNRLQNGSKTFTYDARNRLLTGDGAMYNYTPRGTLRSSGPQQTKADAYGQVITQGAVGGADQTYKYDALGRVIRDGFAYSGLDNDLAGDGTATYVRGAAEEVIAQQSGGVTTQTWTDLHDDVVGQFTATGTTLAASTVYDPLGKVIAKNGSTGNLGYQSEWTDNTTSRVNMMARWYNTDTGQFDTRDTASNNPAPDSINANRYQYGDANPMTVTDPTGHWGIPNFIKKAASSVTSTFTSAVNTTTSFVSSTYRSVSNYTTAKISSAKSYVKKKVQSAGRQWNSFKKQVAKKWNQGVSKVKRGWNKTVASVKKHTKKWVKKAYHKVKEIKKKIVKKVKQAGKAVVAKAKRVVKQTVTVVKDAAKATGKFIVEHKDAILEVAAIGGAILAGVACTAVTAGVGAVACMVGAGALINLAKDAAQGDIHNIGDALGSMGTGALSGLAGGAGGMIAGKVGTMIAGKVGTGVVGRLATEAAENGVSEVVTQAVTTGRVDVKSAVLGVVPGLGAVSRKSKGAGRALDSPSQAGPYRGASQASPGGQDGPAVSVRQVKRSLGQAGMSVRKYDIEHVPVIEQADGGRAFGNSPHVDGAPMRGKRGRPLIQISDMALASMDEAVATVFHEIYHHQTRGELDREDQAEEYGQRKKDEYIRRTRRQ